MDVIEWLLDSDPAIRWQVMRDLIGEREEIVAAERARVATEGWGARLLDLQLPGGGWSRIVEPKMMIETPDGSATYALVLLLAMGLDPASEPARRAVTRVRDSVTHYEGGRPYFDGEVEPCINGRVLGLGAFFGEPNEELLERLLGEQLDDGGWNCDAPRSRRSSFHSTICVLEGLLEYEKEEGATPTLTAARTRGQEYLLERRMFRSLSSGDVIDPVWILSSFPTGWHYDVLRGLDYLRRAAVAPDERVADAVASVERNRRKDGRWPLQNPHPDGLPFDMGEREDAPSRWNTLRALRVLDWAGRSG